jgi:hypothetical protein
MEAAIPEVGTSVGVVISMEAMGSVIRDSTQGPITMRVHIQDSMGTDIRMPIPIHITHPLPALMLMGERCLITIADNRAEWDQFQRALARSCI